MSNIWLTRPLHQADALISVLSSDGKKVLHIPMLEIEALTEDEPMKGCILNYEQYDLAFFISTNAAKLGMECINNYWPQYPAHIKNFALGPSTAKVLQEYDLEVTFPPKAMSSEAVLALPELAESELKGRKVLVFRGLGGRELLAEQLREKGATVDYLELYRRNQPEYSASYLKECLQNSMPDAVVISSAEALTNFIEIFEVIWPEFLEAKLYVSSPRIAEIAAQSGFKKIITMPGANDETIIKSLQEALS